VLSAGCASQPSDPRGAYDPGLDTPRSVSARQYGYVRPAVDVRVIGRDTGLAYGGGSAGDLWDRVRRGPGLGINHHARVDRAIQSLQRNPAYLTDLARRARPYLHVIVGELERAGLPTELALLPEVESRYNPRALSPKSASGMWQFMPYTGIEMGLEQNSWYDARNDILASTRGAIAYLRQLYREFDGDWALALASYNAGPARVRAAQRANEARGRPTDFWSLSLPTETELYVPKLLAVASLVREPSQYGMRIPPLANRPTIELVQARSQIDLADAARHCGVPLRTLQNLNPGLKRGKTPRSGPHYVLVPLGTGDKLRRALAKSGKLETPAVADNVHTRLGDT
jgi:membrane-bound lytic murein transglycosylase D